MQYANASCFRKGDLYLATDKHIVKVDSLNPMNSQAVVDLPPEFPPIKSMFTLEYDCERSITYAMTSDRALEKSIVYEIDFDRKKMVTVCTYENDYLTGLFSPDEWTRLDCSIMADLDGPSTSTLDFELPSTCGYEQNIVDSLVFLYSGLPIDSIILETTGVLNPGEEVLDFTIHDRIEYRYFRSTPHILKLVNIGGADFEDFERTLQAIRYENRAADPTPGPRIVGVTVYAGAGELVSETSFSYLHVGESGDMQLETEVDSISCFGAGDGRIQLAATDGQEPYQYLWEDGAATQDRSGLSAGWYPFSITDTEGCTLLDSVEIVEPPLLSLSINAPADTICGSTGSLNAVAEGGTPAYTYQWSNGQNQSSLQQLPPGDYGLTLTDAQGCQMEAAYSLQSPPTIVESQVISLCSGEVYEHNGQSLRRDTAFCDTLLTTSGCDSIFCLELQFLPVYEQTIDAQICAGEDYAFNGLSLSRDTTFCVTLSSSDGCDSTVCLNLQVIRLQSRQTASICPGEIYTWQGQSLSEPGVYFDTLTATNGCDSILNLELEQFPLSNLNIVKQGSLCAGEDVQLSAEGFASYLWSTGSTASSLIVDRPGTYSLQATDTNACVAEDSISLIEGGISEVYWTAEDPSCFGFADGRFTLDSVSGGTPPFLLGLDGQPLEQVQAFTALSAGNHSVLVEDLTGCRQVIDFILVEPDEVFVRLPDEVTLSLGDSLMLDPTTNMVNFEANWTPPEGLSCNDCLNPVANPAMSTFYQLEMTDQEGCQATAGVQVTVDRRSSLFVPNTFSPNGDGINDELIPYGGPSVAGIKVFRVFDRWGTLLFEKRDFLPGQGSWDGRYRGEEVPKDVYIYQIEIERIDGESEVFSGDVLVLR